MKNPSHTVARRVRKITAYALTVAFLLPFSTVARAQGADGVTFALAPRVLFNPIAPPETTSIRRSLARLDQQVIAPAGLRAASDAQRGYRGGRRGRGRGGDQAMWGLVLGAIGGFVVGGLIGADVSSQQSCGCTDPGLHGFAIGAPIGAVLGGFLGYAVAR
jgi:hypothetical protein